VVGIFFPSKYTDPTSRVQLQSTDTKCPPAVEVFALPPDPKFLFDGPTYAARTIALAHGAGAAMDSPFLEFFAKGLGKHGFRVARFEFPYMAAKRATGQGKAPDREPVLRDTWLKVVKKLGHDRLVIGGKSMGGRIASLIADDVDVPGFVCLGYPFHPTSKPDRLRVEHLRTIKTPTLIVQGERDPFGSRDEVASYRLSSSVRVAWLQDGDHSFKPRKRSGSTEQQNWEVALDIIVSFLETLPHHGLAHDGTV
jgi:predicted alpha/beta-hydrolase family hydrolase